MQWTADQLADALGVARPSGLDPLARVAGVSIDSRTLQPGELFIAIRGPRHDGHSFVGGALERGATAGVVAQERFKEYAGEVQARLFAVDDPLEALQRLASRACQIWRQGKPGRIIGAVAGSVGKTTTKEILAALLGARFGVLKTLGNLNNEYGLPLTLLKIDEEHGAAVVELGMSHRGELARLAQIASPEVGVVTRVAVEHLEFFSSVEEIALAERELIENLAWPSATAVLNADDERVTKFAEIARGPVIRFGTGAHAEFRAEAIEEHGIEGSAFEFVSSAGRARLDLPLIGRHNVMNALAALAAASVWGIGAEEAKRVFPSLTPADKRGEVVRFEGGFTVINDTYNSSPTALSALTQLLAATPGYQRRIVAAGEMLELGDSSGGLHRECGRAAAGLGQIDWILGVQGYAVDFVDAAVKAGHPRERAAFFENSQEAAKFLEQFIAQGDLLLLKGSRGVRMERILEAMDARHHRVGAKPVRETLEAGRKGRS
ncbi:MAG TPA: UDP-N-acetylmuramoyl-tripeptide--D-alanyl-D-alanine ligase [Candidatus Acidoferrales bacterium]|jgi:UDP-N-acetylmuramoyl-tripeptide--D-alanyl-D-alanine ligase|nr:UDP-N-acetylmuramoyl-tripeptide--D-alanyl-D-alanine ligase [Candidatus Acidoferrales bacterium]